MPRYKIGEDIYIIPDEDVEKMLEKFPNAILIGEDKPESVIEDVSDTVPEVDIPDATTTPGDTTTTNLLKEIKKDIEESPLFSPADVKIKIIEDAKLEFDNLISGGTEDLTSTDEIFKESFKKTASLKRIPGSSVLFSNLIAEILPTLGRTASDLGILPEILQPEELQTKPLMSKEDQAAFKKISELKEQVAVTNLVTPENPYPPASDIQQYIIDNEEDEGFIDDVRNLYAQDVADSKEEEHVNNQLDSLFYNEEESTTSYSRYKGAIRPDLLPDRPPGTLPEGQQKELINWKKYSEKLGEVTVKNEFKLKTIVDEIEDIDVQLHNLLLQSPTTQDKLDTLVDEGKKLFERRKVLGETYSTIATQQVDVFETDEDVSRFIDLVGRDRSWLSNMLLSAGSTLVRFNADIQTFMDKSGLDFLGIGTESKLDLFKKIGAKSKSQVIQELFGEENLLLYRDLIPRGGLADKIDSMIAKPKEFPEFSTLNSVRGMKDLGQWTGHLIATQSVNTAVMLTTGPFALPILGASAAGNSFNAMQKDIDLFGAEYSQWDMYRVAYGTGLAEALTETITLGQLKRFKKAFNNTPYWLGGAREYGKRLLTVGGIKKAIGEGVKTSVLWTKDITQEGGSEVVAGFFQRLLERDILGKNVGLFDGAREEFLSGAMMSGVVYRAPGVGLKVMRAFQPSSSNQQIGELQAQMKKIALEMRRGKANGMNALTLNKLKEDFRLKEKQIHQILAKDFKNIDKMSNVEKKELMSIEDAIYKLKQIHDKTLNDSTIDPKDKKIQIERLNGEYVNLVNKKATLFSGVMTRTFGEKAAESVKKEIAITKKLAAKTGKDKPVVVLDNDEFNKLHGVKDEDGNYVDIEAAEVGGKLILNKDIMLREAIMNEGNIASGTHELLHKILKAEFSDPIRGKELADEFMGILQSNNKEAYDGVIKRLYDRGYDENYLAKNPDEYLAQFFSYIKENDVKYEQLDKGFVEKLMDWLSKTFGIATTMDPDNIKFKNGRDAYNFILNYKKDIGKGKLSERAKKLGDIGKDIKTPGTKQSKAETEVSVDLLAKQYKDNPEEANVMGLIEQYQSIALAALGYNIGKGTVQPKEAISFVNSQFEGILKRWDGKQKLSTWIYANIQPKKQQFYESEIGVKAKITSLDDERVKQIAAEEITTGKPKEEKGPRLIDPRTLTNVKNKIKEIEKEVQIKEEQVTLSNFKWISDTFGAKVASIIYNVPESKIKDATKNLTYARKFVDGIPESSEAGNIQKDFAQVDEVRRFLNILPPFNISTPESTISKQGEIIPTSKDVQGRSLGLAGKIQDYFYENYIDPKGEITTPKGRSKGSTSQVNVKILKPEFRDNISNETIKQLQKDLGITPTGQLNIYDRTIGQFLKGIAKLKGAITANTIIDQQIEKLDIKTAKGKEQVTADTRAGRSKIQYSRAFIRNAANIGDTALLRKFKGGKGQTWLGQEKWKTIKIDGIKTKVLNPNFNEIKEEDNKLEYTKGLTGILMPAFPRNMLTYGGKNYQLFLKTKTYTSFYTKEEIRNIFNNKNQAFGKPFTKTVNGKEVDLTNKDFMLLSKSYNTMFPNGEQSLIEAIANGSLNEFNNIARVVHGEMWKRFNKLIKKDSNNVRIIASFLGGVANITNHYQKIGAPINGYEEGFQAGRPYVEWEHARPATDTYRVLLNAALDRKVDFETAYNEVMENFHVIALKKDNNKKLADGGLTQKMPPGETNWLYRYFNEIVGAIRGGINPRNLIWIPTGKTFYEQFQIDNLGNKVPLKTIKIFQGIVKDNKKAATKNSRAFPKKLSKATPVNKQIEILGDYDKAAKLGRSLKTPKKGISVFDFDNVLAKTNSKVLYTLPNGKKGKLSASDFAIKAQALEDAGAVFDFSQFSKIVEGKKGPLADLALKRQGKFGSKDIFIVTARPQESAYAISEFLKGIGLDIPLANITGLENGTPVAKANWVAEKAAQGYNDFYFADDVWGNVKAVKEILDQIDVKSEVQHVKFSKAKKLNEEFNLIIEKKTGLGKNKQYSPARAKTVGAHKGKWNFWIPYSAEDFVGLLYPLLGKGKEGDAQMAWFKKNFLDPFNRAENTITEAKVTMSNDFKTLKKQFSGIPKTLKKEAVDGFTYEDALRIYIWNKQGDTIEGLAKRDVTELLKFIENNTELKLFADELIQIQKGKPYPSPSNNWLAGTLTTDMMDGINKVNRAEYLQEWQENVDIVFSKENLNKLEATHGALYVEAIKNMLTRMRRGTNKLNTGNRVVNNVLDWVNNSVGAIMFLNTKSAVLQTISAINFINWTDNNVLAAGAAFANQPQFWKDFMRLFNSDFLVSRRKGLKINVTESEIADAAEKGSVKGVIAMLLRKGFVLTRIADSFAIASGGATFYRNRMNKLMKDGMSEADAEKQAFLDFYDIAEENQQSSRTDRISMQQASDAGRVILAFANTPMQYARLSKKAFLDFKNGRGDYRSNISKMVYYTVVQNIIFNAIQNALFTMLFNDDDEIPQDKAIRTANGMMDSVLRGLGIGGAAVATAKNIALKIHQESGKKRPDYQNAALELLDFSPPISSKVSKFRSAGRTVSWNAREINEKGFSLDNPAYLAGGQVLSAATNIPLDRVIKKANNISDAIGEESEVWQKIALLLGWSMWELESAKSSNITTFSISGGTSKSTIKTIKRQTLKRQTIKRSKN